MRAALKIGLLFPLFACVGYASAATWFVETTGGPRYDATYNATGASCDGKSETAFNPAGAPNQSCPFQEVQYMWDLGISGAYHVGWVSGAGDTIVVKGCTAVAGQVNPDNPRCRIGWSAPTGGANIWCYGVGSYTCFNPQIPNNTTILGGCAYGTYTCNPVIGYPYTSNLTQLFCGFSLTECINLRGASGITIKGIELTTHNQHWNGTAWSGNCTYGTGAPSYPFGCASNQPLDDYAQNGFFTDANTTNLTVTDVSVHGFNASGFYGPIGAGILLTRVQATFNAFAGWNFDIGGTPNGVNASINGSYVLMEGNGCYEQYPIVNTQFPARACYDTNTGGFGDAWSGQSCTQSTQPTCVLISFICDHCASILNTKDGGIGPHVPVETYTLTNGQYYGNMGEQIKFGTTGSDLSVGGTVLIQNNFVQSNCNRMSSLIPGAVQNFAQSTGLGGSYLVGFCRAGGNLLQSLTQIGSTVSYIGNTFIFNGSDGMQFDCGPVGGGSTNCGSVPFILKDNIFLGYTNPVFGSPSHLYEINTGTNITMTPSYNLEYGLTGEDTCGVNGIICASPALVGQPTTPWPGSESAFDNFNFHPSTGSPVIGAGIAVDGLTADYYGVTRPTPPGIGGVEYVPTGGYVLAGSVVVSGRIQ